MRISKVAYFLINANNVCLQASDKLQLYIEIFIANLVYNIDLSNCGVFLHLTHEQYRGCMSFV